MGQHWDGPSLHQLDSKYHAARNPFIRERTPRKYRRRVRPILPRRLRVYLRLIRLNLSDITFLARYAAHSCLLILAMVTGVIHAFDLSSKPWLDYLTPKASAAAPGAESIWQSNQDENVFYLTWNTPPLTITEEDRAVARLEPIVYQVREGDNPEVIAKRFALQPLTVIWANKDVDENPIFLSLGQILTLPPVDGVIHTVKAGETIDVIAQTYHVDRAAIINFAGNNFSGGREIKAGETIIVPGGIKPEEVQAPILAAAPTPTASPTSSSKPTSTPTEEPTESPPTQVVSAEASSILATASVEAPTAIIPPTATERPTERPTSTAIPTDVIAQAPTSTPIPPTWTAIPPTWTAIPPTWTAIPPTWTAIPPTWTAIPPTWTAIPPTWTAMPPTWTPLPPPTQIALPAGESAALQGNNGCCQWPIQGRITTQPSSWHMAIDFLAPEGTPIKASGSGQVVRVGWDDTGYGNLVIIDHGGGVSTLYSHLSSYPVSYGDYVSQGQIIAYVGATGRATAPHLHFEVRLNNTRQNPYDWLP